ncbi:hypothetical protein ACTXGQ_09900 [Marinobacter sp. 1Y8]
MNTDPHRYSGAGLEASHPLLTNADGAFSDDKESRKIDIHARCRCRLRIL